MATETPEMDTSRREEPRSSSTPPPTAGAAGAAFGLLGGAAAVVNLVLYGIAMALGADMTVDLGGAAQDVGPIAVIGASLFAVFVATVTWSLIAHRVPAFAELWVPIAWGFGIVSLAAILGASGPATAISLGAMHLLATGVCAHLIPRRLPRTAS